MLHFTTKQSILETLGLQHHYGIFVPFVLLAKAHVIEFIEVR